MLPHRKAHKTLVKRDKLTYLCDLCERLFILISNPTNPMLFLQSKVLIFRSPAANTKVVTMLLPRPSQFVRSFQGLFVNEICWICFRFWYFIVILLLHCSFVWVSTENQLLAWTHMWLNVLVCIHKLHFTFYDYLTCVLMMMIIVLLLSWSPSLALSVSLTI